MLITVRRGDGEDRARIGQDAQGGHCSWRFDDLEYDASTRRRHRRR